MEEGGGGGLQKAVSISSAEEALKHVACARLTFFGTRLNCALPGGEYSPKGVVGGATGGWWRSPAKDGIAAAAAAVEAVDGTTGGGGTTNPAEAATTEAGDR